MKSSNELKVCACSRIFSVLFIAISGSVLSTGIDDDDDDDDDDGDDDDDVL